MAKLVSHWPWALTDGKLYFGMHLTRQADIATFEALSDFWGRDASHIYCAGSAIRDADSDTFHVLNGLYAKDSRRAYTIKGAIPEADVKTFEAIGPIEHAFNATNGYAKDSRKVYHTNVGGKACIIKGADPATFIARGKGYGSDASAVFFERKKLSGAVPTEWQHQRGPHNRSGKNAYCLYDKIKGADGRRLESLPILQTTDYWARDGEKYFRRGELLDARQYLDEFRECFIFRGKATGFTLSRDRKPLPADQEESWAIAGHIWIDVVCQEWLQKPERVVEKLPVPGEPFRFGQGLHIGLMAPPTWLNEDRIWIFPAWENLTQANKPHRLHCSMVWWEYGALTDLELIQSLIHAANTA